MSSQPSQTIPVHITRPHRSAFVDPSTLDWVPWVMEGTWFKLLNVDSKTGGFSMLLKVSPNNEAPIHGHLGDVEGFILSGGFGYVDDDGHAGCYVLEQGGINHKPHTGPAGMEMLAIAHSPLVGYHDDGSVAIIVDAKMMYRLARDGGSTAHIEAPAQWTDL